MSATGADVHGDPDELLLVEVLQDWAEREHPGDGPLEERIVRSALEALVGGASLFEALSVGRSAATQIGSPCNLP